MDEELEIGMDKPPNHESDEADRLAAEFSGLTSSRAQEGLQQGEPKMHGDVSELPAELKELVEQMLVEGATFEETVEAVQDRGGEGVTLTAVKSFFRSSPSLQQRRVQKLVATAEELKKAVGADDPNSPEAELLGALTLTSVMQISREGANFDLRNATHEHLARQNLHLKEQKYRMEARNEVAKHRFEFARAQAMIAKARLCELEIRRLKALFATVDKKRKLDQKTYERIQAVYGLLQAPLLVPREDENSEEE